jgi:predicted DNA-binding transcriptional regulator YafY
MNYLEYLKKLDYLIFTIEQGKTGCADCLAEKIGVSRRTLFRYMEELRDQGAVIKYSKTIGSYILDQPFNLKEKFLS